MRTSITFPSPDSYAEREVEVDTLEVSAVASNFMENIMRHQQLLPNLSDDVSIQSGSFGKLGRRNVIPWLSSTNGGILDHDFSLLGSGGDAMGRDGSSTTSRLEQHRSLAFDIQSSDWAENTHSQMSNEIASGFNIPSEYTKTNLPY